MIIRCYHLRKEFHQQLKRSVSSAVPSIRPWVAPYKDVVDYMYSAVQSSSGQKPVNASRGRHIVEEHLSYVSRPGLCKQIVTKFEKRKEHIRTRGDIGDKQNNPLVTIVGAIGSGKSTELVHFAESAEYREYAESRRECEMELIRVTAEEPIVSLISFKSGMIGGPQRIGLRLIYGALMSSCDSETFLQGSWTSFHERFAHHAHMHEDTAVDVIRAVLGNDRLMFIGVDELSNNKQVDDGVMSDLGVILQSDSKTDVLLTAFSPAYVHDVMWRWQRPISYILLPPAFDDVEVKEYLPLVNALIEGIKQSKPHYSLGSFGKGLLRAAPMLASGHPSTVQLLVTAARDGSLLRDLRKAHGYSELLSFLCHLECLGSHTTTATTNLEREMLLSGKCYDFNDPRFAKMYGSNKCHIAAIFGKVTVTTTLVSFVRMLADVSRLPSYELNYLSGAIKELFSEHNNLSTMWERCFALSLLARIPRFSEYSNAGLSVSSVFGLRKAFNIETTLKKQLVVEKAKLKDPVQWYPNKLVTNGYFDRTGWDFVLCSASSDDSVCFTYVNVNIDIADHLKTGKSWLSLVCEKIVDILKDHFLYIKYPGSSKESEIEQLQRISIVFSVYSQTSEELEKVDKAKVHAHLRAWSQGKKVYYNEGESVERAMRYVQEHFDDSVRFMGKADMDKIMIPATLPLARLQQAVGDAYFYVY